MSDRKLSCEQRIGHELSETERRFAELWKQLDTINCCADLERSEFIHDELEPLSIEVKPVLTVMFSWGGPSDWLEIELDNSSTHEVERVAYHYADWFDHAEQEVSERKVPALWRAAEYYAEQVGDLFSGHGGESR